MNFKLDPIRGFAAFLIVFSAVALGYNFSNEILLHLALTLGLSLVLYVVYTWISSKKKNVWDTVITGLLIFLVLHYNVPAEPAADFNWMHLLIPVLATFFAMTLKFFVEWKSSPIVNPAAAGILLSAGVAALVGLPEPFVSWWGASYWLLPFGVPVSLFLLLFWILGGFRVWRKMAIFVAFLIAHAVFLYLFTQDLSYLKYSFMDSFIYFFASIMLPEPKTSPFLPWKQVVYAIVAAGMLNVLLHFGVQYFELYALIAANLLNAVLKFKPAAKPLQA